MITFSRLGNFGRLGNQLFQYALVRAVSLKLDLPLELSNLENKVWHNQKCLLPEFKIKYLEQKTKPKFVYLEKEEHQFDPGVFTVNSDTDFFGYFQHPSYFIEYKDILIDDLSLKNEKLLNYCKDYLSKFTNPTSIHIRLGDYLYLNQCHENYLVLLKQYISEAISKFPSNTDFLVFTGGSRNGNNDRKSDFEICKNLFSEYKFHYIEGNSELVDFELIKNCSNTIMAWDSTFSWWASFLNTKAKVICTDKYQWLPLKKLDNWILI